ncbi:MAG: uroporphyrinogen-III C-methyltransferase [Betaproteobacteria bacterium]|nr:uroporphyrinogen-III C-methyltransferase [Betaproteobacteria bacterium]
MTVNFTLTTMSDPNDRPVAPAGRDQNTPEAASSPREADPGKAKPNLRAAGGKRPVSLSLLIGVGALAVLAAAGLWLDGKRTQQSLRIEVAQRLSGIESSTQAAGRAQTQLATDLRDAQAKITLLEARLAESQAEQAALEALYRDLAPSRDEIAISEIEQVLLVASQQLQLAGNVSSALTALQLAEAKLQRLDRPQFVPLRRALARDIDRLKAVPYVDVVGMSLKLDRGIAAVDSLPLAMDERVPPPAPDKSATSAADSPWRRFLADIWSDAKQLIRIEVADRPAAPLVPMAQQYFLRENLKLRLLTARIALLARDDASFQADLAAVDAWLKQYFDSRAKPVQALQATVHQLAASPVPGETPDLNGSLEALRVLRLGWDRAGTRGPAAVSAPR